MFSSFPSLAPERGARLTERTGCQNACRTQRHRHELHQTVCFILSTSPAGTMAEAVFRIAPRFHAYGGPPYTGVCGCLMGVPHCPQNRASGSSGCRQAGRGSLVRADELADTNERSLSTRVCGYCSGASSSRDREHGASVSVGGRHHVR